MEFSKLRGLSELVIGDSSFLERDTTRFDTGIAQLLGTLVSGPFAFV
jgi:hypothetical protein